VLEEAVITLGDAHARDAAFAEFFGVEYPRVAGYCFRLLRDEEAAHEAAQEAFTRLYCRWVRTDDPRPYVFRIATNLVYREWRRRSRPQPEVDAADAPDLVNELAVQAAVAALPRRLREVVVLFYFAELRVGEIAVALDRPEGTVKAQLSEARGLLAQRLGGTA